MAGVPPKKGSAYTFYTALTSQADAKLLKANPTLAAGDVKVSIDGGAFANLATLPDAQPDASASVRVQLSADEMDGDNIVVQFIDAAGDEWCSQQICIQTDSATIGEIEAQTDLDEVVEGTLTVRHILRLLTSFIGAKVSGGGTGTITFRDIGDTKPRITMTVDADSGDRSAVTLDGS